MADFNEYKGVWVFCEQRQGKLMRTRVIIMAVDPLT